MAEPSLRKTLLVTLAVAVICSFAVSVSAIALRPRQQSHREPLRRKNVLLVTGLWDPLLSVDEAFRNVEPRVVDLDTGAYVPDVDPAAYDPARAVEEGRPLPPERDVAEIGKRERLVLVHLVWQRGRVDQIVLPVRGTGWSTLHGLVALDRDLTTVRGLFFHEHGETPGLGGEVDNPAWRAGWAGKQIYDDEGGVRIRLVKGKAEPAAVHDVDGLTGATQTSEGITNLLRFWFGDLGFRPYLARLKEKGVDHG